MERLALGRYAGLMYQRAPGTEASILAWGQTFDDGIQNTLNRVFPGMRSPVETTLAHRRTRLADLATRIGSGLASASWFVVTSGLGEAFVLSDTPVVATVALGFDDEWHAILSAESNVIVMPLNPVIALVMAPRHIIPLSSVEATTLVPAINRLMWRAAARFVLGRSRAEVEAALGDVDDASRRMSVRPRHDAGAIRKQAEETTERSVLEALVQHRIVRPLAAGWQHWNRCRLELGYAPFAAEDRDLVLGPVASFPVTATAGSRLSVT